MSACDAAHADDLETEIGVDPSTINMNNNMAEHVCTLTTTSSSSSSLSLTVTMVECRICLDEDILSEMETPCECRGNLMYAHKTCIHKWYHMRRKKTCEICLQPLKILAPAEHNTSDDNGESNESLTVLTIEQAFEAERLNEQQERAPNTFLRFLPIVVFQAMLLINGLIAVFSDLLPRKGNHNYFALGYIWWSFFAAAQIGVFILMGLGMLYGWLPRIYVVPEDRDGRWVHVLRAVYVSRGINVSDGGRAPVR